MTPLELARGAIGTRFRLHGRSRAEGLDCVGLVALAYGVEAPRGYALRSDDAGKIAKATADAGLIAVSDEASGDLLLFRAGPGQLHMGITSEVGVVHADASLRRVVERPGPPPWPVIGRWRRAAQGES